MSMSPIRVVIADDQPRARAALRALLGTTAELEVVGVAEGGERALEMVERHLPDVLVVDVEMPDKSGLDVVREVRARWPQTRLIAISMLASHRAAALDAGADAFIGKADPPEQLLAAVLEHTQPEPR